MDVLLLLQNLQVHRRVPGIDKLEIDIAQFAKGAVGADFRGTDGAFEDVGYFRKRQFLEAGEKKDFTVIVVKAGQRGMQQRVIVMRRRALRRVRRLVRVLVQMRGIGCVGRVGRCPEMIGGTASREMIHPRGEATVIAIRVTVLQHALKNGLGDVFGRGAVSGQLHEKAKQRSVMALEEFAKGVELAVADGEHQRMIGAAIDERFHGPRACR